MFCIAEALDVKAIVAVKSIFCSYPYKAQPVLMHTANLINRQLIDGIEFAKSETTAVNSHCCMA